MIESAYQQLSSQSNQYFIVVAGNIGSGKTTLTNKLAERLGWRAHFESVENNPYLEDFYTDMNRWSFPLQVYFLTHRFDTHKMIEDSRGSAIQDRSIYEDANIFARALYEQGDLSKRDYDCYLKLYTTMTQHLNYPTLMIFLKRSVPNLLERIKMRGRGYEEQIPVEYLTRLNRYYDEWFDRYDCGKSLMVDTNELDLLNNEKHFDDLIQKIYKSMDQRDMFFPELIS